MHLLQVDVGRSLTTITEGSVAGLHVSLVERFVACPHTGTLMSYYVPLLLWRTECCKGQDLSMGARRHNVSKLPASTLMRHRQEVV